VYISIFLISAPNDDDAKEDKGLATCDETIIPDNVISIEASDSFIKARIMKLPDSVVAGTRNSEEGTC
jgi:adenylate kinase